MTKRAIQLIRENINTHKLGEDARFLDLGCCGIDGDLPEDILECQWIEKLNLGKWYLTDKGNQAHTANDDSKNVLNNQIFSKIAKLKALKEIFLADTFISNYLILKNIPKIEVLDLSNNEIGTSLKNIPHLKNLKKLLLNSCQIYDIEPLNKFTSLELLDLANNQISDLSVLSKMINLKDLYIGYNKISNLIPIQALKNLRVLSFDNNKLESLNDLHTNSHLQFLYLHDNLLENLDVIPKFKNLEVLDIRRNKIKHVSTFLPLKKILEKDTFLLLADDNPFLDNENLILSGGGNHREIVLNVINRLAEINKEQIFLPVKILLLGNHASGKSSLLHYIQQDVLPDNSESTHIINIEQFGITKKNYGIPKAIFFDFGGQDYYHGIYRAFLSPGAVQIMLWNIESNKNLIHDEDSNGLKIQNHDLHYWLGQKRYLEKEKYNGEHSSLVLVQSHADTDVRQHPLAKDFSDLCFLDNEHFLCLSKKNNININGLKRSEHEAALKYFKISLLRLIEEWQKARLEPKWYIIFIKYVLKKSKEVNLIKAISLAEIKRYYNNENDKNGNFLQTELDQLHKQGLILYYRNTMPDCVWLNPKALVTYIHKKILNKKTITNNKGIVTENYFSKFDQNVIGLLRQQKVIFLHKKDNGNEYIIPNYLPFAKEDKDYHILSFGLQVPIFVLKFENFIPFGLINQMITFYGERPDEKRFWRDQILFSFEGKLILIKLDFNVLEIRIFGNNQLSIEEKRYLFYSIMALYWDTSPLPYSEIKLGKEQSTIKIEGLKIDPEMAALKQYQWGMLDSIFNNHSCFPNDLYISIDDENFIQYLNLPYAITKNEIITFQRIKNQSLFLNKNEGSKSEIFQYQPFTDKILKKMKNIFISYSHDDIQSRKNLQGFLINLEREKRIKIWQDSMIQPGEIWDETIKNNLENSDIIILLISQSFIASTYIYEVEMAKSLKKASEKSAHIVPFLLKDCDWKNWKILPEGKKIEQAENEVQELANYQFMPMDENQRLTPLSDFMDNEKDRAWRRLTDYIREITKK